MSSSTATASNVDVCLFLDFRFFYKNTHNTLTMESYQYEINVTLLRIEWAFQQVYIEVDRMGTNGAHAFSARQRQVS